MMRAWVDEGGRPFERVDCVQARAGARLEEGPVNQTLRFTIDESRSYEFVCHAHLNIARTIVAV